MDKFHSIVIHVPAQSDGVLELQTAFVEDDMLEFYDPAPGVDEGHDGDFYSGFDLEAWGWLNGGLEKLLKLQQQRVMAPREALFFHGPALFGNFDDAKNNYLFEPNFTGPEVDDVLPDGKHTPFGMVIPHWRAIDPRKLRKDGSVEQYLPVYSVLSSATIILYWQEQ